MCVEERKEKMELNSVSFSGADSHGNGINPLS